HEGQPKSRERHRHTTVEERLPLTHLRCPLAAKPALPWSGMKGAGREPTVSNRDLGNQRTRRKPGNESWRERLKPDWRVRSNQFFDRPRCKEFGGNRRGAVNLERRPDRDRAAVRRQTWHLRQDVLGSNAGQPARIAD